MFNELVSIIIPVYNVEQYVAYTIEDVCRQTYSNLQIILIDDGSPDKCGEICDQYAKHDNRIEVYHTENRGLSAARNLGIDKAEGKYIYFLDSDDRIHEKCIEILLEIAENQKCDIVQSRTFAFIDDEILKFKINNRCYTLYTPNEMCDNLLTGVIDDATIVQNKLYRADLFSRGLRFPEGRIHEDVALVYLLIWNSHRIAVTESKMFYYRSKRPGSITHSPFSLARLDSLTAEKERYMFFYNSGETRLYELSLLQWYNTALKMAELLNNSSIDNKYIYINSIKQDIKKNNAKFYKAKNIRVRSKIRILLKRVKLKI